MKSLAEPSPFCDPGHAGANRRKRNTDDTACHAADHRLLVKLIPP
jgi:hypothetical protein